MNELEKVNNLDFFKKEKELLEISLSQIALKHLKQGLLKKALSISLFSLLIVGIFNMDSIAKFSYQSSSSITLEDESKTKEYINHAINHIKNSSPEEINNFNIYLDKIIKENNDYGNKIITSLPELVNSGKINNTELNRIETLINRQKIEFANSLLKIKSYTSYTLQNKSEYSDNYQELNQTYMLFMKSKANLNYIYPHLLQIKNTVEELKIASTNEQKNYIIDAFHYYESLPEL